MVLLYIFLRKKFKLWKDSDIFLPSMKIVLASLISGVVAQITKSAFGFNNNELDTFCRHIYPAFSNLHRWHFSLCRLSWWMKIEEFEHVKTFFMRRIFGQPQNFVEAEEETERGICNVSSCFFGFLTV